jgi:hypothetical protein
VLVGTHQSGPRLPRCLCSTAATDRCPRLQRVLIGHRRSRCRLDQAPTAAAAHGAAAHSRPPRAPGAVYTGAVCVPPAPGAGRGHKGGGCRLRQAPAVGTRPASAASDCEHSARGREHRGGTPPAHGAPAVSRRRAQPAPTRRCSGALAHTCPCVQGLTRRGTAPSLTSLVPLAGL